MKKLFLCAIAALALAACQQGNTTEQIEVGEGKIAVTAAVSGQVATRAEGINLATPELSDFTLSITGTENTVTADYAKQWASLSDYRTDDERYAAGWYTVAIANGDVTAEGYTTPCFTASKSVQVLDRNRTVVVELNATVANAIILVKTTEAFDNYFPQSEFTVTTATNTIDVDKQAEGHLFIAPQNGVKIDCTCIRQANLATGKTEQLATQTIALTKAATRYIVTYDLTSVGGVDITITLNEDILDTIPVDTNTELNPNA